ncbi:hypothetical protein HU200_027038 [Digitaria exilis]|uniref:Uncharacterized protein n=1 Tax=Digitaria exilis TaxID=1010633 RepID=A0A835BYR4_9POAL|nr:hypothetical protein HU200_027038 [Digitaria exilis]
MDKEDEELPDALFSVLHPDPTTTTTTGSFPDKHLARFIGRSIADLLGRYTPVTSRNGLVVLRRRHVNRHKRSERRSDLCVYNPITGERTFLSYPPDYWDKYYFGNLGNVFVLLTAEDGIGGCDDDFTLLVADFNGFFDGSPTIRLQTMSSPPSSSNIDAWSPVKRVGGDGWEVEAVIDMEAKLRSLCPEMPPRGPAILEFMSSGEKSRVALLRMERPDCRRTCGWLIVLGVETGEMRKIWGPYCFYLLVEVDMCSRLRTMKAFS